MIPIRVPSDAKPVLASERRMNIAADHPMGRERCPVCDYPVANAPSVLVFVGIGPEDRKDGGWTTGAAVAVHALCAGVPEEEPQREDGTALPGGDTGA